MKKSDSLDGLNRQLCLDPLAPRRIGPVYVRGARPALDAALQRTEAALEALAPTWSVHRIRGEAFREEAARRTMDGTAADWIRRLSSGDALLCADPEELAGDAGAQPLLCLVLDELRLAGRPVWLFSRWGPEELPFLSPGLAERLDRGTEVPAEEP